MATKDTYNMPSNEREPRRNVDMAGFTAQWRDAEPRIRRRLRRFGIDPQDFDDVMGELALRMLIYYEATPDLEQFVLRADMIARSIALLRMKQAGRRADRDERAGRFAVDSQDFDYADTSDHLEWQLALRALLESRVGQMGPGDIRGLLLALQETPLSDAERVAKHRAISKLRQFLEGQYLGLGMAWSRLRDRYRNPPPLVPALAAVAVGLSFGQLVETGALVVEPRNSPAVEGAAQLPVPRPERRAADTLFQAPSMAPSVSPTSASRHPISPPRPLAGASAVAQLPRPGSPGRATVQVVVPLGTSTSWATVPIYCDSQVREALCRATEKLPPL